MARKNYTEEFRRQAVDLHRSTPGATLRGIAADLGISRHTLQVWVHALDPELHPGPPRGSDTGDTVGPHGQRAGRAESAQAELAALRAPGSGVEDRERAAHGRAHKLGTERDILRQAAKYFAGETNW